MQVAQKIASENQVETAKIALCLKFQKKLLTMKLQKLFNFLAKFNIPQTCPEPTVILELQ